MSNSEKYPEINQHPRYKEWDKVVSTVDMGEVDTMGLWRENFGENVSHSLNSDLSFKETCIINQYLIGFLDENSTDRPIYISIRTWIINGKYVILWGHTGRYVDFDMLEKWVKLEFKNAKIHTDEPNFHFAIHYIREITK